MITYRQLFQELPVPACVLGTLGEVLLANEPARQILELPADWMETGEPWTLHVGERWRTLIDQIREALDNRRSSLDLLDPGETGRGPSLRVTCRAFDDQRGGRLLLCVAGADTARTATHGGLREAAQHLRRIRLDEEPRRTIQNVLVVLRNALGLDRALFLQRDHPRPGLIGVSHEATRPSLSELKQELTPVPASQHPLSARPLTTPVLLPHFSASRSEGVPLPTARTLGAKSMMAVEVRPAEGLSGFLLAIQSQRPRRWSAEESRFLAQIGWALGLALEAGSKLSNVRDRLRWSDDLLGAGLRAEASPSDLAGDLAHRLLRLTGLPFVVLLGGPKEGIGGALEPIAHASRGLDLDLPRAFRTATEVALGGLGEGLHWVELENPLPARSTHGDPLRLSVALCLPTLPASDAPPTGALVCLGTGTARMGEPEEGGLRLMGALWATALARAAHQERRSAERQALAPSAQNSEIARLAAGMVHDFNNILGIVTSYASSLASEVPEGASQAEDLQVILDAAAQGSAHLRQLRSLMGEEPEPAESVDVVHLMRQVRALLDQLLGPAVEVELELAHDLPLLAVAEAELRQAILDLCFPAEEVLSRGGRLRLAAEEVEPEEDDLPPTQREGPIGPYLLVTLEYRPSRAQAPEQTPDEADAQPALEARPSAPPIMLPPPRPEVVALVDGLGGFLTTRLVEPSVVARELYLPLTGQEEHRFPTGEFPAAEWAGQGQAPTVLLIDDEPHLRTAGERNLSRWGYQVLTAPDGEIGVRLYQRFREAVLAVILDLIMPGMDGRAAFRALKAIDPDVLVVVASGFVTAETKQQLSAEGVAGFVAKPYTAKEVHRALRAALEQRRSRTRLPGSGSA